MRVAALLTCLLLTGCSLFRQAGTVVSAQKGGWATGAGATLDQPANSAAPSTQKAERVTRYIYPDLAGTRANIAPKTQGEAQKAANAAQTAQDSPIVALPDVVFERVETTLGQHQDASAIMKVAAEANKWGKMQWIGLVAIIASIGALLWSAGHNEGYPAIYIKTGLLGIGFMFCDSPWWLLLGLIPLGFYLAQRLGIIRFPLP